MNGKYVALLLSCCMGITCGGCSYKALTSGLYTGFKEEQKRKCYETPHQGDIQQCLERVNAMSYDDYTRYREESIKRSR